MQQRYADEYNQATRAQLQQAAHVQKELEAHLQQAKSEAAAQADENNRKNRALRELGERLQQAAAQQQIDPRLLAASPHQPAGAAGLAAGGTVMCSGIF